MPYLRHLFASGFFKMKIIITLASIEFISAWLSKNGNGTKQKREAMLPFLVYP
jgi:hypothetical protein